MSAESVPTSPPPAVVLEAKYTRNTGEIFTVTAHHPKLNVGVVDDKGLFKWIDEAVFFAEFTKAE